MYAFAPLTRVFAHVRLASEGEVDAIVSPLPSFPETTLAHRTHPSSSSNTLYHRHSGDLDKSSIGPEETSSIDKDSYDDLFFPDFDLSCSAPNDPAYAFTPAATSVAPDDTGLFPGSDCSSPLSSAPSSDDEDESPLPDAPSSSVAPKKKRRRASAVTFSDTKRASLRSQPRRASTSTGGTLKRKKSRNGLGTRSRKRTKLSYTLPPADEPSIGNVCSVFSIPLYVRLISSLGHRVRPMRQLVPLRVC